MIARSVLDEHQAGLYAGGLILTKAVLFLPQFVVVIVFPSMSSAQSARRLNLMALGLVLAIGLATVAGIALLPDLAVMFVGGPEYAELRDLLWLFAGLGTLLAMLQLMVYNVVARQRQRAVFVVWSGLVLLLALGSLMGTVRDLVLIVIAVDALVFGTLLLRAGVRLAGHRGRHAAATGLSARRRASCAGPDRDVERHGQLGGGRHLGPDQLLERRGLPRRHFEHELVVDLEQHPRPEPGLLRWRRPRGASRP